MLQFAPFRIGGAHDDEDTALVTQRNGQEFLEDTLAPQTPSAAAAPIPSPRAGKPAGRPSSGPESFKPEANTATCRHLSESLRKVLSTMRSGYSASQGERLRNRKRELEARRRQLKC